MMGENSKTERKIAVKMARWERISARTKATSALLHYHRISDQDTISDQVQERLEDGLLSKCGDPK